MELANAEDAPVRSVTGKQKINKTYASSTSDMCRVYPRSAAAAEPRYRALAGKKGMVECQRRGDIVAVLPRLELAAVDVVVYPRHVDVLHGEGKICPAATRNNTTRNPAVSGSRRQLQEALRWQQYQTKPHHDKPFFVFLGIARRLELSLCNTTINPHRRSSNPTALVAQ